MIKETTEEREARQRAERQQASIRLLGEIDRHMKRYLYLTQAQRTAMIGMAGMTNAMDVLVTHPNMAWINEEKNCGKSTCMKMTRDMSFNPHNAKSSTDGLMSLLVLVTKTQGSATLFYDEIGKFYGDMGSRQPAHILNDVLLEGYQEGAERTRSVRQAPETASLFHPVLVTGRHVSMPDDVADRMIFVRPERGMGLRFYDSRVARPRSKQLGTALHALVRADIEEIRDFRGYGLHPKLTGRVLELWEPIFAVLKVLGGQEWLNRAMEAFLELAAGNAARRPLSAREQMLSDINDLLDGPLAWADAAGFVPGELLAAELKRTGKAMYTAILPEMMMQDLADTLDLPKRQVSGLRARDERYPYNRSIVYDTSLLREEWADVMPDEPDDTVMPEFDNPFAINDDDDFEDVTPAADCNPVQGVQDPATGARGTELHDGSKPEPEMSLVIPPCEDDEDDTESETKPVPRRRRSTKLPAVEAKFLKENALA